MNPLLSISEELVRIPPEEARQRAWVVVQRIYGIPQKRSTRAAYHAMRMSRLLSPRWRAE